MIILTHKVVKTMAPLLELKRAVGEELLLKNSEYKGFLKILSIKLFTILIEKEEIKWNITISKMM